MSAEILKIFNLIIINSLKVCVIFLNSVVRVKNVGGLFFLKFRHLERSREASSQGTRLIRLYFLNNDLNLFCLGQTPE